MSRLPIIHTHSRMRSGPARRVLLCALTPRRPLGKSATDSQTQVKEIEAVNEAGTCAPIIIAEIRASLRADGASRSRSKRSSKPPLICDRLLFAPRTTLNPILTPHTDIHGGKARMSSLSRRACFKCGNVGHYAGKPHLRIGSWRAVVTPSGVSVARRRLQ
jgi:hypothetical protein